MVLPAAYVTDNVALAYAATVHSAQGRTVDTSHIVVTPRTSPNALYVGMSRGRDSNLAHVTTEARVADPADGREDQTIRRHPVAAVAIVLDPEDRTGTHSALATATRSTDEATNVRTPAELLADAAQLAATQRTATWLDELTLDGTLSLRDRSQIAAEDGAASLTRVLRNAELAGLDAREVLRGAIADRPLDGARNATNVIYSRITDRHCFDPVGETWADWTPRVDDPQWQAYLDTLAQAADDRAATLGLDAAEAPPRWALDAFGPPPAEIDERAIWTKDVGAVAAYRELRGHDGDADALGPAPAPGQVEAFAAYRAAWRALGRPEIDREEIEMSDGQLRMRIRAAEREAVWAPRYVASELAGTHQAADTHRRTAALRAAEAEAAGEPDRTRLLQESRDAAALASTLDTRAVELQQVDDARARWLAHTAGTRAAGDRAQAELSLRKADEQPEPVVTADEWLAAHHADQVEEDRHREITEAYELDAADGALTRDQTDPRREREPEVDERFASADAAAAHHGAAEPSAREVPGPDRNRDWPGASEPDIREQRAMADRTEDAIRVPGADETADAVARARQAIAEMEARDAYDAQQAELDAALAYEPAELDHADDDAMERS
jgi:hypothetical protein